MGLRYWSCGASYSTLGDRLPNRSRVKLPAAVGRARPARTARTLVEQHSAVVQSNREVFKVLVRGNRGDGHNGLAALDGERAHAVRRGAPVLSRISGHSNTRTPHLLDLPYLQHGVDALLVRLRNVSAAQRVRGQTPSVIRKLWCFIWYSSVSENSYARKLLICMLRSNWCTKPARMRLRSGARRRAETFGVANEDLAAPAGSFRHRHFLQRKGLSRRARTQLLRHGARRKLQTENPGNISALSAVSTGSLSKKVKRRICATSAKLWGAGGAPGTSPSSVDLALFLRDGQTARRRQQRLTPRRVCASTWRQRCSQLCSTR